MSIQYRASFERLNFNYNPPLKQTSDVLFETDIPFDDEHIEKFEKELWATMWKQNPHFAKAEGGWSSIFCGKVEKVVSQAVTNRMSELQHRLNYLAETINKKNDDLNACVKVKEQSILEDAQKVMDILPEMKDDDLNAFILMTNEFPGKRLIYQYQIEREMKEKKQ